MTIELLFQDGWQRLKSLPDDPHNSISLGKSTSSAQCFALIFPVSRHQSMPFGERQCEDCAEVASEFRLRKETSSLRRRLTLQRER